MMDDDENLGVSAGDYYDRVAIHYNEAEEHVKTVKPRYSYFDKGQNTRGERSTIRLVSPTSESSFSGVENPEKWQKIFDSNNETGGFANFFLQRIAVHYTEKSQIIQTFGGADVVYYFGQAPVVFNLGGLLFDDVHNGWFCEFAIAYNEVMRGTRLAQHQQLIEVDTPSLKIVGTISNFSHSQDSTRDTDIPFDMSIIVQKVIYKPFSKNGKAQLHAGERVPTLDLSNLNGPTLTQESINDLLASGAEAIYDENGVFLGTVEPYSNTIAQSTGNVANLLDATADTIEGYFSNVVGFLNRAVSPVEQVLGAVRNVTNSGVALVRSVETSVQNVINVPMRVLYSADRTEALIKDSVGIITFVPETMAEKISRFIKDGSLDNNQAILEGSKSANETAAILSSRTPRTGPEAAEL